MTHRFASLDSFTQGYIEAAFFTETGNPGEDLGDASPANISQESWEAITDDCAEFQRLAGAWMLNDYGHENAGHDFWMTRNGHGVGFWEGDYGEDETWKTLDKIAKDFAEVSPYRGDDGRIYGFAT